MGDIADAYVEVQQRVIGAVIEHAAGADTAVAYCPGWSVHDVVAHLTGYAVDVTTGHIPEFVEGLNLFEQWRDERVARARDAATARQVAERKDRSMRALADEWTGATAALIRMIRGEDAFPPSLPPFIDRLLLNDVVVHEGDIRSALGLTHAPADAGLSLALAGYSYSLGYRLGALKLPALVLAYDGKERQVGVGEVGARVHADRYELLRVLAGRRTPDQMRALDWQGDPTPYLGVLSEYGRSPSRTRRP